ncbi:DoxX family protein [Salinifilum aidingensis]
MHILRDLFALVARVGIGVVLIAHGWQKFVDWGIAGTAESFRGMGVPSPTAAAWFAAVVELVGGVLLVLGLLLPLVGVAVAVDMAGAALFVHAGQGLFVPDGVELVLVLGVATLALGFGGGRWSLDHGLFRRRGGRADRHARADPRAGAGDQPPGAGR